MGKLVVVPEQCTLFTDFLDSSEGYLLLNTLQKKITWEQFSVKLFGKTQRSPRLTAWYGDSGARYRYSGISHHPQPWLEELSALREKLRDGFGHSFNSVLLNYYRDGRDSMGAHSDDEKELGSEPIIASLSVGASRRFVFHPRNKNRKPIKLDLPHGSLLVMEGKCQKHWKHSLPKTSKPVGPRINLTFRKILF